MNKTRLLWIVVVLCVLSNVFLLWQFNFRQPHHPHRGEPKNRIIEKLKFDDQQQAQYRQLIEQHQRQIRQSEDEILQLKNQLYHELIPASSVKKDSLVAALGDVQMRIEKIHFDHFIAIRNLCTEQQIPAFNELSLELADLFNHPMMPPAPRP